MNIFEAKNYKDFIRTFIKKMPKKGRGQFRRMALHLGIHPVVITQVFNGDRDLSLEQAAGLTHFFSFSSLESEYFISLVEWSRAGNESLRTLVKARLNKLTEQSQKLENRVPKNIEISAEAKAIFYSAWYYSGARLASSLVQNDSVDDIAKTINVDRAKVAQVIEFLLANDLCVAKNGRIKEGPQFTHLTADSPFVAKHHTNWRLKSINAMERPKSGSELFYTLPMSLSQDLTLKIRTQLLNLIEDVTKQIKDSRLETLYCMNIDWFRFSETN
ncbi:MAG: TIGR02147 family protein [Pseudomonadota bacterium]|nr:TIGR02147 family protein [Pseudomonadota bacterium]